MQPGTKSESLREEMEEAANRMEICRVSHQPDQIIYHFFSYYIFYCPFDK